MDRGDVPLTTADDLLQAIGQQDRQAFSALYDEYSSLTFGIAKRVIQDRDIARESMQDVWLEIWDKASTFDSARGSARAWIARIAHNRAVDVVRSNEASRKRLEVVGRRDAYATEPPASEKLEQADEHRAVSQCLESLTEIQREAVFLAYYSGLTHKQISQRTGSGLSATKTRLRDGMLALRRCMNA